MGLVAILFGAMQGEVAGIEIVLRIVTGTFLLPLGFLFGTVLLWVAVIAERIRPRFWSALGTVSLGFWGTKIAL